MKKRFLLLAIIVLSITFSYAEEDLIILPDYFIKGESENINDSLETQKIEEEKQNKDSLNLESDIVENEYSIKIPQEEKSQANNYFSLSAIWSYIESKYSFSKENSYNINAYFNRIYLKENWETNLFKFSLGKENRFFEISQFYGKANFSDDKTSNYFSYLSYQDLFQINENISLKPNFSLGYYNQKNTKISKQELDIYGDLNIKIAYSTIQFEAIPYFYKKNIGLQGNIQETEIFDFIKLWAALDKDGVYPSFEIDFSERINKKINSNVFFWELSNKPFVEKENFTDYLKTFPTLAISENLSAKYPFNFNTKFIFENIFSSQSKFSFGYTAQYVYDKNFYYYNSTKSLYDVEQVKTFLQTGNFNFNYSFDKYVFENDFSYNKSKILDDKVNDKKIEELSYFPQIKNYFSFTYKILENLGLSSRIRYETLVKDENENTHYDLLNLDAFCKWQVKKNIVLGFSLLNILDLNNNIYQDMPRSKFWGMANFEIYF